MNIFTGLGTSLVVASDAPIELRIDRLESSDLDVYDRAMGR